MNSTQNEARIAASNNADLCAAIMTANGKRFERDQLAFLCLDDPLPYYPKMVSLDPNATAELEARIRDPHGKYHRVDSVKDSFASMDTSALGLMVLFKASWIWCEAERRDIPPGWVRIDNAADLSDWHSAWSGDNSSADQVIFPAACLNDPSLAFLARRNGTIVEAGCVANLSENAVGLSNVFSVHSSQQQLFDEALSAVSAFGGGRPVVGYEQGDSLAAALSVSFRDVGPLRVLLRRSSGNFGE
jgi:hypothetical protein